MRICLGLILVASLAMACGNKKQDEPATPPAPDQPLVTNDPPPDEPAALDTSCQADSDCVPAPDCCPEPCSASVINKKDLAKAEAQVKAGCDPDMQCPDAGDCAEHAYLCVANQCKLVMAGDPDWRERQP